jgi:hypothetical protein
MDFARQQLGGEPDTAHRARALELAVRRELARGQRAATAMSLVHSARLNGHDPYAHLRGALERLPTQPASWIAELPPHHWRPVI